jgi:hypothetical protein
MCTASEMDTERAPDGRRRAAAAGEGLAQQGEAGYGHGQGDGTFRESESVASAGRGDFRHGPRRVTPSGQTRPPGTSLRRLSASSPLLLTSRHLISPVSLLWRPPRTLAHSRPKRRRSSVRSSCVLPCAPSCPPRSPPRRTPGLDEPRADASPRPSLSCASNNMRPRTSRRCEHFSHFLDGDRISAARVLALQMADHLARLARSVASDRRSRRLT